MRKIILIVIVIFIANFSHAQNNSCIKDFDYLVSRIKNDYPGYLDKVNKDNEERLKRFENDLREKIKLYPDSCRTYLRNYTEWFNDNHLRISQTRSIAKTKSAKNNIKYKEVNISELDTTNKTVEGVWISFGGTIAIKKIDDENYVAVAINYRGYEKHQVIFEFSNKGENKFNVISYRKNRKYMPVKETASLHQDKTVLEIHDDTRYVRKTDNPAYNMAFLSSYIPQFPNGLNTYPVAFYLSDSTYYLRIPGFYSDYANNIVIKHWQEIISRPNLIIDIRNNGGGQDIYYEKLAELIYTNSFESKGVEWYSTKGIIEDWEYAIANGEIKEGHEEEAKALTEEMKKNIGGFITHPYYGDNEIIQRDSIYSYPRKIGVIINEQNASSAEQFLLEAQNSSKVTIFGKNNTAGILDYSNATPKEMPSGKYNLLLPASRSKRLPENPIDNIGIAPDIIIPVDSQKQLFDRLDNWVYFVKNYLENKK